jgi:hypothetical protein
MNVLNSFSPQFYVDEYKIHTKEISLYGSEGT